MACAWAHPGLQSSPCRHPQGTRPAGTRRPGRQPGAASKPTARTPSQGMPAQGRPQMLLGTQQMPTASSPVLSSPGPSGRLRPRLKLGLKLACSCQTGCHRTQGASSTVRLGAAQVSLVLETVLSGGVVHASLCGTWVQWGSVLLTPKQQCGASVQEWVDLVGWPALQTRKRCAEAVLVRLVEVMLCEHGRV